ncbi:MAG: adenylosuccinate synthetase, partial [Candidatus Binataceae bacterium]
MNTVAVVGTQWGDEGKGKIIDLLARDADIVVRFQGGNNAAHTIVVEGEKFILRLVPAGALHPGKICVIGNGAVVDPVALLGEIDDLKKRRGFDGKNLKLSYEAHMVMPYHRAIDRARETRAGKRAIGTTGFGIGPTYEDKMARVGLRFDDLLNFKLFADRLRRNVTEKNAYLKAVLKAKPVNGAQILEVMKRERRRLLPYLCDTGEYLASAISAGKRVLFEGAHGTMLDIDHGTYPYVTSS